MRRQAMCEGTGSGIAPDEFVEPVQERSSVEETVDEITLLGVKKRNAAGLHEPSRD